MKPNPQLNPEIQAFLSDCDVHEAIEAYLLTLQAVKQTKMARLTQAMDQENWSQVQLESSLLDALSKQTHKLQEYQQMLQLHAEEVPVQNPDLLCGVGLATRVEEPALELKGSFASETPKEPRKIGEYTEPTVMEQGVLWALYHFADPVPRRKIVEALEPIMEGHLTPDDLSLQDDGTVRWHRKTGDAAVALSEAGLVGLQRQGRTWFITEAGRTFVESGGIHTVVASDMVALEYAYLESLDSKVHLN